MLTAGIGFKPEHFAEAMSAPAEGLWFEVHAENYMVEGGPRIAMLQSLRGRRPLSLHGVGLSLASSETPDPAHLAALKRLCDRFEPALVSEHLAWSRFGELCFPDLLPFPRDMDALRCIIRNICIAQDVLGRQLLIENPSHYLALDGHEWCETEFLGELVLGSGCGLLIDVNNIVVSANNLGFDAADYVDALPVRVIGEIHIAGHRADPRLGNRLLIDNHDAPVAEPVWRLLDRLLRRTGPVPVLLERDGEVPPFDCLLAERNRAAAMLATITREECHYV
jgi:uncharacterized protein (UPF0276 family)